MKLEAVRHNEGFDSMAAIVGELRVKGVTLIMMTTFENEVDDLLAAMDNKRTPAVTEALLRRYSTAEDIHKDLTAQIQRLDLKMQMLGEGLVVSWTDKGTSE